LLISEGRLNCKADKGSLHLYLLLKLLASEYEATLIDVHVTLLKELAVFLPVEHQGYKSTQYHSSPLLHPDKSYCMQAYSALNSQSCQLYDAVLYGVVRTYWAVAAAVNLARIGHNGWLTGQSELITMTILGTAVGKVIFVLYETVSKLLLCNSSCYLFHWALGIPVLTGQSDREPYFK